MLIAHLWRRTSAAFRAGGNPHAAYEAVRALMDAADLKVTCTLWACMHDALLGSHASEWRAAGLEPFPILAAIILPPQVISLREELRNSRLGSESLASQLQQQVCVTVRACR